MKSTNLFNLDYSIILDKNHIKPYLIMVKTEFFNQEFEERIKSINDLGLERFVLIERTQNDTLSRFYSLFLGKRILYNFSIEPYNKATNPNYWYTAIYELGDISNKFNFRCSTEREAEVAKDQIIETLESFFRKQQKKFKEII